MINHCKGRGYSQKSKTKSEILVEISLNIYLEIKTFKNLFSILYYMMKIKVLDLDDDILNIIGDYVKKDNIERMEKERMEKFKQDVFEYLNIQLKEHRKFSRKINFYISRHDTRIHLWQYLKSFVYQYFDNIDNDKCNEIMKIFNEYLTLKKLNLKEGFI